MIPARTAAAPTVRAELVPGARVWPSACRARIDASAGRVALAGQGASLPAIDEGNRSLLLPSLRTELEGREWMLSIKGAGARGPAYSGYPREHGALPPRVISGERWNADAPYGGQGESAALHALSITALAEGCSLGGAMICPLIGVVEVPPEHVRSDVRWYRRQRGACVQEQRLVPSDVRLFAGSDVTLGGDTARALDALGVHGVEAIEAFVERYLASGIAALTLWARTARMHESGVWEGLDLDDAWLDKDSVIAADGTLFLVDLEALEWTPLTHRVGLAERVTRQLDRNYYELMFALDAVLDLRDRLRGVEPARSVRCAEIAARAELACAGDPFVRAEDAGDGLDLFVRAPSGQPEVRVRFVDRR